MKGAKIAAEITRVEGNRDRLAGQLDSIIARFRDCVPPIAESWIKDTVRRQIERYPDQVQSLGVERLRSLKEKERAIVSSLSEIVKTEIDSSTEHWPHKRTWQPDDGSRDYHGNNGEKFFFEAFRDIVSNIGPALDEFGLLKDDELRGSVPTWRKVAPGEIRYCIGFGPPHDIASNEHVKEYRRTFSEWTTIMRSLDFKRQELAKAQASELFESA